MVSIEQLRSAYSEAIANGNNIAELADKLGIKIESLNQRLTMLRADLRKEGATEEEIQKLFPRLTRRVAKRVSKRSDVIASLLSEVRQ